MKKTDLKRFKKILLGKRVALLENAQQMKAENMVLDTDDMPGTGDATDKLPGEVLGIEYWVTDAAGVRRDDREFATAYAGYLFPSYRVDEAMLDRSKALLAGVGDRPVLERVLLEANDDLSRAIKCRAFAAS